MSCIAVFSQKGFLEMPFITHVISNFMVLLNLLVHKISILKKEELTVLLRNRPHDENI